MLDDGSDELFAGFWPFMRRFLLAFLPVWVFLLGYAAGLNLIIAAIIAGMSVSSVAVFEKIKLKQRLEKQNDDNNVIKE
tara:strand:- start:68 stop:304 length:237 start_codon:yes stop_codon:yes gene_type:complete